MVGRVFEVLFLLAVVLPAATVLVGAIALLAPTRRGHQRAAPRPVAAHT